MFAVYSDFFNRVYWMLWSRGFRIEGLGFGFSLRIKGFEGFCFTGTRTGEGLDDGILDWIARDFGLVQIEESFGGDFESFAGDGDWGLGLVWHV